jgi:hypothetical protein
MVMVMPVVTVPVVPVVPDATGDVRLLATADVAVVLDNHDRRPAQCARREHHCHGHGKHRDGRGKAKFRAHRSP